MRKILLQSAFSHIQPSPDFVSRTLCRLAEEGTKEAGWESRPQKGRPLARPLAVCLSALLCILLAAGGLPFARRPQQGQEGVFTPDASAATASGAEPALQLDGSPVPYESLQLPPDDGLDFSGETFGSGIYSVDCKAMPNYAEELAGAELAVKVTVEGVRYNHYAYDEIDDSIPEDHFKHRLHMQEDTLVYELRVEKVYGARRSAADIKVGDLLVTENQLYSMTSIDMNNTAQRMQRGHRYILVIDKGSNYMTRGGTGITYEGAFTKESCYLIAGDLELFPMIELTRDGGYLFYGSYGHVKGGWYDLVDQDTVRVTMPADTSDLIREHMYLRAGLAFEEDFQRLVNRNLLQQTE